MTSQKLPSCGHHQTQHILGQLLTSLLQSPRNFSEVALEVRPAMHTALLCLTSAQTSMTWRVLKVLYQKRWSDSSASKNRHTQRDRKTRPRAGFHLPCHAQGEIGGAVQRATAPKSLTEVLDTIGAKIITDRNIHSEQLFGDR